MTDFPTLSYTSTNEIPTLSYTLKPFWAEPAPAYRRVPPPPSRGLTWYVKQLYKLPSLWIHFKKFGSVYKPYNWSS